MPIVGVSPPRALEPSEATVDGEAPEPSPVPPDFRSHLVRTHERFLSRGHGERFDAILWANDAARSDAGAETAWPDGAVFVEETIAHDARGDRSGGLLVMTKQDGAWRFSAVGPDGAALRREEVASCALCHREAKDDVFRLPL